MEKYFLSMIDYLRIHPDWGFFIAFIVAFAESLPVIGTIVPGSITMTAIGTLIGSSVLPGFTTILVAIFGAFCGDFLGYYVGRRYDYAIKNIWPFKKRPQLLTKGEAFFAKHGGKSIIIGRFIGPVRSAVPLIAGFLKLSAWRFVFAAVPSAILWALLYFLPGIFIGALAVELPPSVATKFVLYGICIVILIWLAFWLAQRAFAWMCSTINRGSINFWQFLQQNKLGRGLAKLIHNQQNPADNMQLLLFIGSLLFFAIFVLWGINVFHHGFSVGINRPVFFLLQSWHSKDLTLFFSLFTILAHDPTVAAMCIVLAIYWWFSDNKRAAVFLVLTLAAAAVPALAVKHFWYFARPTGISFVKTSSSFPSGHAVLAMAIFSFITFLLTRNIKKDLRWIAYWICFLVITAAVISRIYLGAHWLSDVLGSVFLGSAALCFMMMLFKRQAKTHFNRKKILVSLLIILACWAFFAHKELKQTVQHAQPIYPSYSTTVANWWHKPLATTTPYFYDHFGKAVLPLNIEWLGFLNDINNQLLSEGWKNIDASTLHYHLMRFTSNNPIYHLPVLQRLYNHHHPVLVLVKHLAKSHVILELHLWHANTDLYDTILPLWVGNVTYQLPSKSEFSAKNLQTQFKQEAAVKRLQSSLSNKWRIKKLQLKDGSHALVICDSQACAQTIA